MTYRNGRPNGWLKMPSVWVIEASTRQPCTIMSELLVMRYAHVASRGKNSLSPPKFAIRATHEKKRSVRSTTP